MGMIWEALKTVGGALRDMYRDPHLGTFPDTRDMQDTQWEGGGFDDAQGYLLPEADVGFSPAGLGNMLPPAEHNGWGTADDYTYGMPD